MTSLLNQLSSFWKLPTASSSLFALERRRSKDGGMPRWSTNGQLHRHTYMDLLLGQVR